MKLPLTWCWNESPLTQHIFPWLLLGNCIISNRNLNATCLVYGIRICSNNQINWMGIGLVATCQYAILPCAAAAIASLWWLHVPFATYRAVIAVLNQNRVQPILLSTRYSQQASITVNSVRFYQLTQACKCSYHQPDMPLLSACVFTSQPSGLEGISSAAKSWK